MARNKKKKKNIFTKKANHKNYILSQANNYC